MSILTKIGITKEAIARLLGVHKTVAVEKSELNSLNKKTKHGGGRPKGRKNKKTKHGGGRPKGRKIPQWVVEEVRNSHKTFTAKELSEKYGVSHYWVWAIRNNKFRK